MGRASNERPSCSSKAKQIFRSAIGIHHKSFNILILVSKSFLSQVFMLDIGGSMLGYLNSHLFSSKPVARPRMRMSSLLGRNASCCDFEQLFPKLAGVAILCGTGGQKNPSVSKLETRNSYDGHRDFMTTSNTVVAMANSLSSLGAVLRELRKARDLIPTLLGQMAEISVNHFSATERGAANPSIDVLNSLTDGIDVSPSCFLACCDGKGPLEQTLVVRSHNRRNSNTLCAEDAHAIGCQDLLLSSSISDAFDMGLAERGSRSETPDDRMQTHDGEAQGIFLEGELEMWTDDETILPKAGDSYSFDARFPRRARNTSNKPCSMIWAGLPVAIPKFAATRTQRPAEVKSR